MYSADDVPTSQRDWISNCWENARIKLRSDPYKSIVHVILVCGLQEYAVENSRRRASVPKYQVYNNALKSIYCETSFREATNDRKLWEHLFESAIGCHVVGAAYSHHMQPYYWRDGNNEVDFVLKSGSKIVGMEVKSSHEKYTRGLTSFRERFKPHAAFFWESITLCHRKITIKQMNVR